MIEFQRKEIDHTLAGDEQLRRDQRLLHEQLSEQNRDLRVDEMEELKRFPGSSRFDEISRRRLTEQNEVNCLNDSGDFKVAESVRSGLSHVPSQPAFFPTFS